MAETRESNTYSHFPSSEPRLDFEVFADKLCEVARERVSFDYGSFTIGIFGSWGSGKTTLMKAIERKFKKEPQEEYKTVWFNPWKYDHNKEVIQSALIQTILSELIASYPDGDKKEKATDIRKKASVIFDFLTDVGWDTFKNLTKNCAGVDIEYVKKRSGNNLPDNQFQESNDPYRITNNFENAFGEFVKEHVGKLVIFIDDLDRCLPENALNVLEALKLYLDKSNCIFIIGLDKRVIEQAVKQKYQGCDGITGREYIEKIIQLNFFLPEKDPIKVQEILKSQLTQKSFNHDNDVWKMVHEATDSNVRKTKQFIIAFDLLFSIGKAASDKNKKNIQTSSNGLYKKLARILLMQLNFPDFLDAVKKDYSLLEDFELVCEFYRKRETEQQNKLLDKQLNLKHFWDDYLLRNFMAHSSICAKISSREELSQLLRLVSYNAATN